MRRYYDRFFVVVGCGGWRMNGHATGSVASFSRGCDVKIMHADRRTDQIDDTTPHHTHTYTLILSMYLESSSLQAKKVTHSRESFKDGGDGGFFE